MNTSFRLSQNGSSAIPRSTIRNARSRSLDASCVDAHQIASAAESWIRVRCNASHISNAGASSNHMPSSSSPANTVSISSGSSGTAKQPEDVDVRVLAEQEVQTAAPFLDPHLRFDRAPYLVQQPTERGERVVRLGLEPTRDVPPRRWTIFEQQVRQESPGFAARQADRLPVAGDRWGPQELNAQRHAPSLWLGPVPVSP